ncbi:hypothetical protein NDN08_006841 [Rhodosorus marinus]|uniref:Glutamine cyclotransferase n=1 Tax=Rhodosorus marinus TaxID=101924 RepID=A0AAV8UIU1_9RHOD|nr:hypothetical protein NDN08_006841 [Rhodosorus marinus]
MVGFVEMVSLSTRRQTRVGMSTRTPVFKVKVVDRIDHDCFAFTQGLAFDDNGDLFESTGMHGESEIRRLDPDSGEILQREALEYKRFGEGVTISRGHVLQLTWRSGVGFIRDRQTLKEIDTWEFEGDGWGITTDDSDNLLFLTDGTEIIRILDATTLRPIRSMAVTDGTRPIKLLNDIQFIEGELWANVWMSDVLAVIDATTGSVNRWIDLRGLLVQSSVAPKVRPDVLNGLAYDPTKKRVLVTGKYWPQMFYVEVNNEPIDGLIEDINQSFVDLNWLRWFTKAMNID